MANETGSGKGIYLIVGGLVVAVAVMAYFLFGGATNEPELEIGIGDSSIEVQVDE